MLRLYMLDRLIIFLIGCITFGVYCIIGVWRVPRMAMKKTRRFIRRELSGLESHSSSSEVRQFK